MKFKRRIIDKIELDRILKRMANEVIERNKDYEDLYIVGIHTRGVPLAKRVASYIEEFEDVELQVGALDVTLYRDDLNNIEHQPKIKDSILRFDIEGKKILLVDDVLNTGRTVRAALNALIDYGRPRSIQLMVVVDRGNRELPIQADYVGKKVPTSHNEVIRLYLSDYDEKEEVDIFETEK
ncbi:MAG: bifunctional pyr operon transcriptional regulator/uracil phosphoribosyltransferase PyrR [Candidatus Cloacimonetes bacterium]|nr:bifunctional pyr operon transcriptional regulator/uracil phosphoribosyltransferase PyrR [Candidatus Cloacimonadota bacterium]MBS3767912.1 bifunctional pyr operon transcriptional regulator/uracil phosphoribosyltransferase PyrR [Candidatus Cloacimonadota bacterium]